MPWTIDALHDLVATQEDWVVEKQNDVLSIENDEGLDAYLYPGEKQLIVETVLFPLSAVKNVDALNKLILATHQFVPLTTVGVSEIGGELYYVAFGALSSSGDAGAIVEEIEMLFANTPEFIELFEQHLNLEIAS